MRQHLIALVVAAVIARAVVASAAVIKSAPAYETKPFDPDHPPRELIDLAGQLSPDERAYTYCHYEYSWELTDTIVDDRSPADGQSAVTVTIRTFDLTLRMKTTCWLPAYASDALKAHEAGHRQIGETFYSTAGTLAGQIAKRVIGHSFDGVGVTRDAAIAAARAAAVRAFGEPYEASINGPAQRVHDLYDQITRHGQLPQPTADEAVVLAFKYYHSDQAAELAAVKPTTAPVYLAPTTRGSD